MLSVYEKLFMKCPWSLYTTIAHPDIEYLTILLLTTSMLRIHVIVDKVTTRASLCLKTDKSYQLMLAKTFTDAWMHKSV